MIGDSGAIRITFPAALALKKGAFAKTLEGIAEQIGCRACFSGVDCVFQRERDYVVNEKSQVAAAARGGAQAGAFVPTVNVAMPEKLSRDIGRLKELSEVLFGKLGCLPCTSGFDVRFRNEWRTIAVDEQLNVREFGRGF